MLALIIFLSCVLVALGTGVLAAWSDIRGMVIPNIYSVIVGCAFIPAFGLLFVLGHGDVFAPVLSHLLAALIVFGVTAGLFALRVIGAADSKLATVYALWTGLGGLAPFLFYMSLSGAVLGLIALVLKKRPTIDNAPEGSWIAQVQSGESKVPYGVAIVIGALVSFVHLGYINVAVLQSFVLP